jgi:acetyl esterase/lipase
MQPDANMLHTSRVVYELDGMAQTRVRKDLIYKTDGDESLCADLYLPPDEADGRPLPAIVFISGDAPPAMMKDLKESGQYVSWGQLAAAAGFAAVTFDHRSTERFTKLREAERDVRDLLDHVAENAGTLGIDPHRVGIWICSGGPPFGLKAVFAAERTRIRAIAVYYGLLNLEHLLEDVDPPEMGSLLREYSPVLYLMRDPRPWPPMLVARAGQDHAHLNASVDLFVSQALARNAEIELHNHAQGRHAFDILDADDRSREIVQRTLDFFAVHVMER